MGWFDSITKRDDPLRDLDPTLREYLEREAPKQYKTASEAAAAAAASSPQTSYREQLGLKHTDPEAQHRQKQQEHQQQRAFSDPSTLDDQQPTPQPLPSESLYPDGRYAHIWKTYRPAQEIAESGKSDQEKLLDIVGGYKERQAQIGRAALENCAEEQWAVHECFRSGSWSAVATMCKKENRELNRCISVQSRFLRALGYLTMQERAQEDSERIQMHADRLYQRMLAEEKELASNPPAAESSILPETDSSTPKKRAEAIAEMHLAGLALQKESATLPSPAHVPGTITYDSLPADVRARLEKEKFAGLQGPALEMARREMDADIAFHQQAVLRLNERYREEREGRIERKERGEERWGDVVMRLFDFRRYEGKEGGGGGGGGGGGVGKGEDPK